MKALRIIFVLTIAALWLPAFAQGKKSGTHPPAPKLSIESFGHDFGEVNSGSPLRFTFKVRNTGDADLLIQSVTPG